MATGYCTTEDVRRVFQDKSLTSALSADNKQIAVDAITAQTQWIQRETHKHWYESGGISEDNENIVATGVKTRDDEHSLPTRAGYVPGAYEDSSDAVTSTTGTVFSSSRDPDPKEQLRISFGDLSDDTIPTYTRIRLNRKDVDAINELHVANETGGFDDWVADSAYTGGVGDSNRGDDYWVRTNNRGVAELYLNVHSMADDIVSLTNAVYVDFDYGDDSLPADVRRGVALIAAAELVTDDEFQSTVPDNGQLVNVETKAERWERQGRDKLEQHFV